jgi:hypothetical protein
MTGGRSTTIGTTIDFRIRALPAPDDTMLNPVVDGLSTQRSMWPSTQGHGATA